MAEVNLYTDPLLTTSIFIVLLLPLLSFLFSLLTSDRYSWLVGLNAPILLMITTIFSFVIIHNYWNKGPILISIDWFRIGNYSLSANIALSNISILMLTIVSSISFLVHVYSIGYMAGDPGIKKYFAMLGFFTFSMQGIVLSDNLLMLFVFWELVGFSSYMLIGHWADKPEAGRAAHKAFIMNRIGDAGFLVGLMIIWTNTGTFDLTNILQPPLSSAWQTAASLCIFCGVMGKSAQFPLLTWLPDAMEGPTPVSALIHAATMVAAGVYLMVRVFPLFSSESLTVVACIGMATSIIGSLAALFHYDIKKILAYSTISQLGLMIMAIGLGVVNAALLHLSTHAFFKACLFLSAGAVIHSLHQSQLKSHSHFDPQDIRNMGGLRKKLPVTFFAFLLSGASLAGIPFFSGFLSKEAILAAVWMNSGVLSWCILVTMSGVSFITVLYTFRLLWFVFMGEERKTQALTITEAPAIMRGPIILLAMLSLWFTVSWNPFDFIGWLLPETYYTNVFWITAFSVCWICLALLLSYFIFRQARFDRNKVLENAFYLDLIYQRSFGRIVKAGSGTVNYIDKKWIDGFIHGSAYAHVTLAHISGWIDKAVVDGSVNGLARMAGWVGSMTRSFQGGKIQVYIFWAILTIIIFLIWVLK